MERVNSIRNLLSRIRGFASPTPSFALWNHQVLNLWIFASVIMAQCKLMIADSPRLWVGI
jgi:hypothetical protein